MIQQRTSNTALVFLFHPQLHGFPWGLNPSVNSMRVYAALQRQPFLRAKRRLNPALLAIVSRLQYSEGLPGGRHYPMSQSPKQLWTHKILSRRIKSGYVRRETDSTCRSLQRTARMTRSYSMGLRRCAQELGVHHNPVDQSAIISRSVAPILTSSIFAISAGPASERDGTLRPIIPGLSRLGQ